MIKKLFQCVYSGSICRTDKQNQDDYPENRSTLVYRMFQFILDIALTPLAIFSQHEAEEGEKDLASIPGLVMQKSFPPHHWWNALSWWIRKKNTNRNWNPEIYPVKAIPRLVKCLLVTCFIRTLYNSVIIHSFEVQITLVNIWIWSTITF